MSSSTLSIFIFLIFLGGLFSCGTPTESNNEVDPILAKVYNKTLFVSDLDGMIPAGTVGQDSVMFLRSLIEKWVRESLLMHEAERNIPQDIDIDELVRDYRASLVRHNYEQILVELQLDSIVSDQELSSFYEKNKDQYQLTSPILRCYFIKVSLNAPELEDLEDWWESDQEEDYIKMVDYANKHAEIYMLNDSLWYKLDEISNQLPKGTLTSKNLKSGKDLDKKEDDYRYFVKVIEAVDEKKLAPLSYIQEQISKLILHKRKIELIESKKEEIYDRESMRNNVKVYLE